MSHWVSQEHLATIDQRSALVEKVVAYVTRQRERASELLVFTHTDFPDAGVQVPAGTVQRGEEPETALMRELEEETGKRGFRLMRKIARDEYVAPDGETRLRHIYHLSAPEGLPDRWRWGERFGTPEQITFDLYWIALRPLPKLAGGLSDYLAELASA